MASHENDPTIALQELVGQLNNASASFNPAPGLEGYKTRVEIITKAKEIVNAMTDPSDMAYTHCTNVSFRACRLPASQLMSDYWYRCTN